MPKSAIWLALACLSFILLAIFSVGVKLPYHGGTFFLIPEFIFIFLHGKARKDEREAEHQARVNRWNDNASK